MNIAVAGFPWLACLLCLLLGSVAGYFLRALTHPSSAAPLTLDETAALVERIHQQTGSDPSKPQAITIPPVR